MVYRHFRIYQPAHLNPTLTYPIVLMLPGNRLPLLLCAVYSTRTKCRSQQLHPRRCRTAVAFSNFSWSWYTDWNWAEDAANNPDLKFLETLVAHLLANYPASSSDVFVAGHSRGAAMSIIAALELPHLLQVRSLNQASLNSAMIDCSRCPSPKINLSSTLCTAFWMMMSALIASQVDVAV